MPQSNFPSQLLTGSACAALDAAVQRGGIAAEVLMARAGAFALATLLDCFPAARQLLVLAGTGNNAGDAYVVATKARQLGLAVTVAQVDGRRLSGAAGQWQAHAEEAGCTVVPVSQQEAVLTLPWASADVLVDGLLGIGLRGAARPVTAALIDAANHCPAPTLALDVPSGLAADRTGASGAVIAAAVTCSFLAPKLALHSGVGTALAGERRLDPLGVSDRQLRAFGGVEWLPSLASCPAAGCWPRPAQNTYKHARGHVVVVGGDHGMHGAVLLAAEAALRSGAGLVSVVTRSAAVPALLGRRPELMVAGTERWSAVLALLERAETLVLGPGLGRGAWGRGLFQAVRERAERQPLRLVLDADALFLLAQSDWRPGPQAVLTPHTGEAARLLRSDSARVEADRLAAVQMLVERFGAVSLLKGPGTLIAGSSSAVAGALAQCFCLGVGNPAMASAGMGDVLAGVVGARLALGTPAAAINPAQVAAAALVHGAAADLALTVRAAGAFSALLATDVIAMLPRVLAEVECPNGKGTAPELSR